MKYWREIIIVVLIVAMVMIGRSCNSIKSDNSLLLSSLDSSYSMARHYVNREGELVAQVNTHKATVDQLKQYSDQLGIEKRALERQVGSLNNLVGYWKGQAQVIDTITTVIRDTVIVDTTGHAISERRFEWVGSNLKLQGTFRERQVTITYDYKFKFELVSYYKPKTFSEVIKHPFKPKQLVSDLTFDDLNLTVSSFKGIVTTMPPKRWYQTTGFKIGVGVVIGSIVTKEILR